MGNTALAMEMEILYLPIDMIKANPYQPRKFFDKAGLMELSASIKEYGLMQPITVRVVNGNTYELVAGERRLRASKMAGLTSISAILVQASEQDSAILAMIENIQRQNLHFIEEAVGLLNLMRDYSLTQEEVAVKVGKSQSAVANKFRILRLSRDVQRFIIEHELTERHARALLKLPTEAEQLDVLKKVVRDDLTVKKTEDLIEKLLAGKAKPQAEKKKEQKIRGFFRSIHVFTNVFEETVDNLNEFGFPATYEQREVDDGVEIVIKILNNKS